VDTRHIKKVNNCLNRFRGRNYKFRVTIMIINFNRSIKDYLGRGPAQWAPNASKSKVCEICLNEK
jgi:hypothetical protein